MKLLYITNGITGSGGLERVLSVKASLLAEQYGYEVTLLVLNEDNLRAFYDFSSKINMRSVKVGGNPLAYFISYRKGLQEAVNEIQPDVISVCDDGLKGFFVPHLIKTNAKIIYERHASIALNTDSSLKGQLTAALMKRQVPKFHKFVVLTPANIREWNQPNVIAIPNPLSFVSSSENPLDQKRVIAVGSHSHNKGYDLLLMIWKNIEPDFPGWRLEIFGRSDSQQTYTRIAEELQLKTVKFHAPVPAIQQEYENSSILVLPSRSEGFGMVLIEAMACGVPCVAFDCPSGPGDIISEGEDGYLIPALDTVSFEKNLRKLMEDDGSRQSMGKTARKNSERYAPGEIVQQWDQLFKSILTE